MKQILLVLGVFAICSLPLSVKATEEVALEVPSTENQQLVEVENAGALFLFQKQPVYEKQIQVIRVKKSGAITIFQINGKIKDYSGTNKQ